VILALRTLDPAPVPSSLLAVTLAREALDGIGDLGAGLSNSAFPQLPFLPGAGRLALP
jgi:hypothetical protein